MQQALQGNFGNPSSIHRVGREAARAIAEARAAVAALTGADEREIVFTSSGTEADNLAVFGAAYSPLRRKGADDIIISSVEHHAVLTPCEELARRGFRLTVLPVDASGVVDPDAVADAISDRTILVSVMHANNEVGTLQPIENVGAICRERGVLFHTDAVQTVGHLPIDVSSIPVDLLSISAHKLYGPKGVGALYVRKGVKLAPLLYGGGHEGGLRSGTENVPGIAGFAAAAQAAKQEMAAEAVRLASLRDRLLEELPRRLPGTIVSGHPSLRLPGLASFCIERVEGESLLLALDEEGIAASSGSACSTGTVEPSHVLLAMGVEPNLARGHLRLSLGRDNTNEDIAYLLEVVPRVVESLRRMTLQGDPSG
jgi:cysteine desulfurase